MRRTDDSAFFGCPVCFRKPYIEIYNNGSMTAFCKGYGIHRHREVKAYALRNIATEGNKQEQGDTLAILLKRWNRIHFSEVRFLFEINGLPFWERGKEEIK